MANQWHPQFTHQDIPQIKEKTLFSGYNQIKQFSFQFPLFEGGQSHTIQREVFWRPMAVAVLLVDIDADKVVLIEQFRIGAIEDPQTPWLLEAVAGVVDEGEDVIETAIRETKEEAGCEIQALIPIYEYLVSPGVSNEKIHIYCGQIKAPSESSFHGLKHESEDIKLHIFSVEEAFQLVETQKILCSHTLIALLWLKLNYEALPVLFGKK